MIAVPVGVRDRPTLQPVDPARICRQDGICDGRLGIRLHGIRKYSSGNLAQLFGCQCLAANKSVRDPAATRKKTDGNSQYRARRGSATDTCPPACRTLHDAHSGVPLRFCVRFIDEYVYYSMPQGESQGHIGHFFPPCFDTSAGHPLRQSRSEQNRRPPQNCDDLPVGSALSSCRTRTLRHRPGTGMSQSQWTPRTPDGTVPERVLRGRGSQNRLLQYAASIRAISDTNKTALLLYHKFAPPSSVKYRIRQKM